MPLDYLGGSGPAYSLVSVAILLLFWIAVAALIFWGALGTFWSDEFDSPEQRKTSIERLRERHTPHSTKSGGSTAVSKTEVHFWKHHVHPPRM